MRRSTLTARRMTAMKHALVVDDSKSAQLALKKQLEAHDLRVSLVDSGEAALRFLDQDLVDVIFMDHTMPGMDGLETLAAVKRNPRTAMIPVMMYTTKEGAVYVGQARALGGIGVLPKDVHPQVLFDMLLKLGLVQDRRSADGVDTVDAATPRRRAGDVLEEDSRKEPYPGAELTTLLGRIIADQAALRAELRYERNELARATAAEAVAQQASAAPAARQSVEPPPIEPLRFEPAAPSRPAYGGGFATTTIAIAALIFAIAAWRDTRPNAASSADSSDGGALRTQMTELEASRRAERVRDDARYSKALDAVQWALNQNGSLPFDQLPFDDARVDYLRDLLERLVSLGFRGRVRIESHLGEFCLVNDNAGAYQLAPPDLPIEACTLIGHPLDDSSNVTDRQSVGFAEFLRSSPLVTSSGIAIELVAHDRSHSLAAVAPAAGVGRAGEWNEIAARNNRLEFSLIPTSR
jgi:CheY-like chemotaxis protein